MNERPCQHITKLRYWGRFIWALSSSVENHVECISQWTHSILFPPILVLLIRVRKEEESRDGIDCCILRCAPTRSSRLLRCTLLQACLLSDDVNAFQISLPLASRRPDCHYRNCKQSAISSMLAASLALII